MKRKILLVLFVILSILEVFATEQEDDILFYQNQKLYLQTGWGHPSPFETYFLHNDIESPFKMISTANYRGFIATWEIKNYKLYLTYVHDRKSKNNQLNTVFKNSEDEKVFASWFSGMIVANDYEYLNLDDDFNSLYEYYIYVRYGLIQKIEKIPVSSLMNKSNSKYLSPSIKDMISLNYRYISYYFRLWGNDPISYKGKDAVLIRKRNTSPILSYYSDDNLLWPYNWENEKLSGAPHCKWSVEGKKVYLNNISLYYGTRYDSPDIVNLPLSTLFPETMDEHRLFASWLNGVFIIQYGDEVKEDFYTKFKPTETFLVNIQNGQIIEEYSLGKDFNFSKEEKQYSSRIESLLKEF